jgi:hypothetical protein
MNSRQGVGLLLVRSPHCTLSSEPDSKETALAYVPAANKLLRAFEVKSLPLAFMP